MLLMANDDDDDDDVAFNLSRVWATFYT